MNFTFKAKCYSFQKCIRVEFCKEFNSCIKIKDVTDKTNRKYQCLHSSVFGLYRISLENYDVLHNFSMQSKLSLICRPD